MVSIIGGSYNGVVGAKLVDFVYQIQRVGSKKVFWYIWVPWQPYAAVSAEYKDVPELTKQTIYYEKVTSAQLEQLSHYYKSDENIALFTQIKLNQ